jgi:type II secretory ATPase GspE/PulE/Tfp pilus assembly ATPase PilB-like protein
VILIGEMRDRPTAEIALQAALTGQLAVTTFHAGDCRDAINRLIDLGIADYALRNAVRLVVAQRLLRRLCNCALPADPQLEARPLGLNVEKCWQPGSCDDCLHTGFRGRALVAEFQSGVDPQYSQPLVNAGRLWSSAISLIERGVTSPAEAVRVLGLPSVQSFER